MTKVKFLIIFVAIFGLSACGTATDTTNTTATPVSENYSDLTACGDFETASNDGGGPNSYYFVCRNATDGQCYYKKTYFEQIDGCDPEFDTNPYGKEECFENKTALYNFNGQIGENIATGNDNCAATTQAYFETKIAE
ncbi:MAG TPA: hypothetical protein PL066_01835 [bacterium]|nr:hypothetical protein [bacterium]